MEGWGSTKERALESRDMREKGTGKGGITRENGLSKGGVIRDLETWGSLERR